MKASKIRDHTTEELEVEATKLQEQVFRFRFQLAIGQTENPMKLRLARKDLARVKTILNEKRRAQGASGQTAAADRG